MSRNQGEPVRVVKADVDDLDERVDDIEAWQKLTDGHLIDLKKLQGEVQRLREDRAYVYGIAAAAGAIVTFALTILGLWAAFK